MKITIIYDNTSYISDLTADWGFSCLIQGDDLPNILFDTGANGNILLSNMKKLHINPDDIELVFISHNHFDHTGGLSAFLNVNKHVTLYVPRSLRGIRNVKEVVHVTDAIKITKNVFSTGELENIEQSMAVKTDKGLVLVNGCSHPRMSTILDKASGFGKVYAIVGGFHGFSDYELFKDMELICSTHCTQHKQEIKSLYPDKVTEGGAGKIIEF
ncbi:MAG: MBL fold metallo-hydrolase [bacterium]